MLQFKWHRRIKDKFKNLRKRKDRNHPSVAAKRLKFGNQSPLASKNTTPKKRNVWGVPNFLPDQEPGEDDTSIAAHTSWLRSQSRLDQAQQDRNGVGYRLDLTFADRRQLIVTNGAGVAEIKEKYPILFSEDQVLFLHTNFERKGTILLIY